MCVCVCVCVFWGLGGDGELNPEPPFAPHPSPPRANLFLFRSAPHTNLLVLGGFWKEGSVGEWRCGRMNEKGRAKGEGEGEKGKGETNIRVKNFLISRMVVNIDCDASERGDF